MWLMRGCSGPGSKPPSGLAWEKSLVLAGASLGMTLWSDGHETLTEPPGKAELFQGFPGPGKMESAPRQHAISIPGCREPGCGGMPGGEAFV